MNVGIRDQTTAILAICELLNYQTATITHMNPNIGPDQKTGGRGGGVDSR